MKTIECSQLNVICGGAKGTEWVNPKDLEVDYVCRDGNNVRAKRGNQWGISSSGVLQPNGWGDPGHGMRYPFTPVGAPGGEAPKVCE